jgi:hypothetical protein
MHALLQLALLRLRIATHGHHQVNISASRQIFRIT